MQNNINYIINFTDILIDVGFRFAETKKYFRKYLTDTPSDMSSSTVHVSRAAYTDWEKAGNAIDAFAEFCLLCQPVSEALMVYGRCVFHAAALRYRDQAFLIAGGSGTGKSTHCRMLLEKYPEEFSVINGDKPILECTEQNIIVHPSPWNGKEGMHGADDAVLTNLILLRRSSDNSMKICSEKEAAVFSFPLVFQSFEDEEMIRNAGMITEQIVKKCTCWIFESSDIEESSELLYHTIKEAAEHEL